MEQKVFSEVLNDLITICDEIDSNIARKAGLNKSYLCKMKKGLMLPPDCSVLEKLMEAMNLNDEDSGKLYRAYMRGKLSDELKRTEKALHKIFTLTYPQTICNNNISERTSLPENGSLITGKENVRRAFMHIMHGTDKAKLIFFADNQEIFEWLQLVYRSKDIKVISDILLYLNENTKTCAENIEALAEIIPCVITGNVNVRSCKIDISRYYSDFPAFPIMVKGDKGMLIIEKDLNSAVCFTDKDVKRKYENFFDEKFFNAQVMTKNFMNISEFVGKALELFKREKNSALCDFYILKRNPCVFIEKNPTFMKELICDKSVDCAFFEEYMKWLSENTVEPVKQFYSIFSKKGLKEFMEDDIYYEYNKYVDRSIPKQLRYETFSQLINDSERGQAVSVHIAEDYFFGDCRHGANIWSDGKMILILNFEDGYRILFINENSIIKSIIDLFNFYKKVDKKRCKSHALKIMKEYKEKYCK